MYVKTAILRFRNSFQNKDLSPSGKGLFFDRFDPFLAMFLHILPSIFDS
jgi:hypothetical protein